jgi:hypothetical protein
MIRSTADLVNIDRFIETACSVESNHTSLSHLLLMFHMSMPLFLKLMTFFVSTLVTKSLAVLKPLTSDLWSLVH